MAASLEEMLSKAQAALADISRFQQAQYKPNPPAAALAPTVIPVPAGPTAPVAAVAKGAPPVMLDLSSQMARMVPSPSNGPHLQAPLHFDASTLQPSIGASGLPAGLPRRAITQEMALNEVLGNIAPASMGPPFASEPQPLPSQSNGNSAGQFMDRPHVQHQPIAQAPALQGMYTMAPVVVDPSLEGAPPPKRRQPLLPPAGPQEVEVVVRSQVLPSPTIRDQISSRMAPAEQQREEAFRGPIAQPGKVRNPTADFLEPEQPSLDNETMQLGVRPQQPPNWLPIADRPAPATLPPVSSAAARPHSSCLTGRVRTASSHADPAVTPELHADKAAASSAASGPSRLEPDDEAPAAGASGAPTSKPLRKTVSWRENALFDERHELMQRAGKLHEMSLDLRKWLSQHGVLMPSDRSPEDPQGEISGASAWPARPPGRPGLDLLLPAEATAHSFTYHPPWQGTTAQHLPPGRHSPPPPPLSATRHAPPADMSPYEFRAWQADQEARRLTGEQRGLEFTPAGQDPTGHGDSQPVDWQHGMDGDTPHPGALVVHATGDLHPGYARPAISEISRRDLCSSMPGTNKLGPAGLAVMLAPGMRVVVEHNGQQLLNTTESHPGHPQSQARSNAPFGRQSAQEQPASWNVPAAPPPLPVSQTFASLPGPSLEDNAKAVETAFLAPTLHNDQGWDARQHGILSNPGCHEEAGSSLTTPRHFTRAELDFLTPDVTRKITNAAAAAAASADTAVMSALHAISPGRFPLRASPKPDLDQLGVGTSRIENLKMALFDQAGLSSQGSARLDVGDQPAIQQRSVPATSSDLKLQMGLQHHSSQAGRRWVIKMPSPITIWQRRTDGRRQ
ncbi:hypothetical protein WJX84_003785 [Apatococcus fuscideae]|uniref:Uncharacterized protein n=1 Tax=Apatococcus fuscideae TaxID=2026836 RepID=A0AAW1TBJ4_9CHLO